MAKWALRKKSELGGLIYRISSVTALCRQTSMTDLLTQSPRALSKNAFFGHFGHFQPGCEPN